MFVVCCRCGVWRFQTVSPRHSLHVWLMVCWFYTSAQTSPATSTQQQRSGWLSVLELSRWYGAGWKPEYDKNRPPTVTLPWRASKCKEHKFTQGLLTLLNLSLRLVISNTALTVLSWDVWSVCACMCICVCDIVSSNGLGCRGVRIV